jgi:hypothetical protein
MSSQNNGAAGAGGQTLSERIEAAWNRFWFTPADPSVLGLVRICAGLITFYTVLVYTPNLQQFFGEHAWWDLDSALLAAREKPATVPGTLRGREIPPEVTPTEKELAEAFFRRGGGAFWPFPADKDQFDFAVKFQTDFNFDFRAYHLPFPITPEEEAFLLRFSREFGQPPALEYPKNKEEAEYRFEFARRHGFDPLNPNVYARGTPIWSIWFHVTDPDLMLLVQCGIILATLLFTIGFCTRITSVLTWMGNLSYIHRSQFQLFGVDTMMTILLLYLMIGPSGAAWSVDRRIARWWSKTRPRIINRWRAWWKLPPLDIAPARIPGTPQPLVSANVAIRLLQVHVCIIYLAAGLSKLMGQSWWNGTAVWGTLANYEFAPMQFEIYNKFLRLLGANQLMFMLFLTTAAYFTLTFEIGYAFLVWRRSTRWVMLGMAITLHGFIGLFMGLKTFSLMMLVMNMAFLKTEEATWAIGLFYPKLRRRTSAVRGAAERTAELRAAQEAVPAGAPAKP